MTTATATATSPVPSTAAAPASLWPQRIEIIGLTGEFASGKTLFGLTIDPAHTCIYDLEKSAGSYLSLGYERVDMGAELLKRFPTGYKPKNVFEWWLDSVRRIEPGKFSVIMLDPVSEVEAGLQDWVEDNPQFFGHTKGQYEKMQGIFWTDVKEYWKLILTDLASRCQTFAFTSHMSNVWDGNAPVKGKRKPKGKETLMELASLYLLLERKADDKGNVPSAPSAIVLKSRLASTRINPDTGEIEIVPTLPPRLPIATPRAVRDYMSKPPDYAKLAKGERIPEQRLTDDERLQLQTLKAQAEAEAERLRNERLGGLAADAAKHEAITAPVQAAATAQTPQTPQTPVRPSTNGTHAAPNAQPKPEADSPATEQQLQELARLRELAWRNRNLTTDQQKRDWWQEVLMRGFKVKTAKGLTAGAADSLINDMRQAEDLSFRLSGHPGGTG